MLIKLSSQLQVVWPPNPQVTSNTFGISKEEDIFFLTCLDSQYPWLSTHSSIRTLDIEAETKTTEWEGIVQKKRPCAMDHPFCRRRCHKFYEDRITICHCLGFQYFPILTRDMKGLRASWHSSLPHSTAWQHLLLTFLATIS